MNMIEWIKPSGAVFVTNDLPATVKYCESLGFQRPETDPASEDDPGSGESGDGQEPEGDGADNGSEDGQDGQAAE